MQEFEKFTISDDGVLTVKSGVTSISSSDFAIYLGAIKKVVLPEGIRTIGPNAFRDFVSMTEINLPDSIDPKGIGDGAFYGCTSLEKIKLPKNLAEVPQNMCFGCESLNSVEMGDEVKYIGRVAFGKCTQLTSFTCPRELTVINEGAFVDCANLESITFNDKLKIVSYDAFSDTKLSRLTLPDSVEAFFAAVSGNEFDFVSLPYKADFDRADYFLELDVRYKDKIVHGNRDEMGSVITGDPKYGAILVDCETLGGNSLVFEVVPKNSQIYFGDKEGKLVVMRFADIRAKVTSRNELEALRAKQFPKLLDFWFALKDSNKNMNKTPLPNIAVVKGMPRDEIPQFYLNNNMENWVEISRIANCQTDEGRSSLFGLAHALGVFSNSGAESKEATNYIKMYILDNYSEDQIHEMFNFNAEDTPYNPEFAKFFMQYFNKNPRFMQIPDEITDTITDYMNAAHDSFKKVLEAFPNKRVVTRQDNDRLTPEIVGKFLNTTSYKNVPSDLMPLAKTVSKYGYSREAFDKLASWYQEGVAIPENRLRLFCEPDTVLNTGEDRVVTYELLGKKNPLCAVLGDITNCCQRVNNVGGNCVKYGMTEPNSGFVVLRSGSQIIGQAWVWYDETTHQLTLDNIEVPRAVQNVIQKDSNYQTEIIDCLDRLGSGFVAGMEKRGLKVSKVTIGKGYNDFNNILEKHYKTLESVQTLTEYNGYTDAAGAQFLLTTPEQERIKKNAIYNMMEQTR